MKIVGCDLHARQQTIAMVDTDTGEFMEKTLSHEGIAVRDFYASLDGLVVVGIERSMQWFVELLEELGIKYRAGHPAKIGQPRPGNRSMIDESPSFAPTLSCPARLPETRFAFV